MPKLQGQLNYFIVDLISVILLYNLLLCTFIVFYIVIIVVDISKNVIIDVISDIKRSIAVVH